MCMNILESVCSGFELFPTKSFLVCVEYLVISVIGPSGNSSKLTSGPFFNNDAHLKII